MHIIPGRHWIISTWGTTPTPFMRTTTAILTGSALVTHRGTIPLDIMVTIRRYMPVITTTPATRPGTLTAVTA